MQRAARSEVAGRIGRSSTAESYKNLMESLAYRSENRKCTLGCSWKRKQGRPCTTDPNHVHWIACEDREDANADEYIAKFMSRRTSPDELREECGVFGIYDFSGENVASTIYYGLFALQHRGQESCGIAVSDTRGTEGQGSCRIRGWGFVNEVFDAETS